MTTTSLSLLFLLAFLIGGLISWLIIQLRLRSNYLPLAEMEKDFVRREIHEQLRREADLHYENLQEKSIVENQLGNELATARTELRHLQEKLSGHQAEMERLQAASLAQFEQTADRLLQEKGQRFTAQNA